MAEPLAAEGIDVCVCTFRRPALAETLRSLAAMRRPAGYKVSIIVSDNDDEPSAKALVEQLAPTLDIPVRYIHSPARNISIARNACLDASRARFVAFIDDDETATEEWLTRLVAAAEASRAEVVLGPVRAIHDGQTVISVAAGVRTRRAAAKQSATPAAPLQI
jgi:succinoglycan biosynthesis protein ExoM